VLYFKQLERKKGNLSSLSKSKGSSGKVKEVERVSDARERKKAETRSNPPKKRKDSALRIEQTTAKTESTQKEGTIQEQQGGTPSPPHPLRAAGATKGPKYGNGKT